MTKLTIFEHSLVVLALNLQHGEKRIKKSKKTHGEGDPVVGGKDSDLGSDISDADIVEDDGVVERDPARHYTIRTHRPHIVWTHTAWRQARRRDSGWPGSLQFAGR